jgi:hypothetical protein
MSGGVANAKSYNYHNEKYNFPSWLKNIKRNQPGIKSRNSIINKISKVCHVSKNKSKLYIYDFIEKIIKTDEEFAFNIKNLFDFNDNEFNFLYGKELDKNDKNKLIKKDLKIQSSSNKDKIYLEKKEKKNKKISMQQNLNDF